MTNLEKLHLYMIEAIRRTTAKEYRRVSAALIPVLPELVTALGQVITDTSTTPAQRLQAAGMLQALWARCLRDEDQKQKHLTNRERLKIRKTKVEAEDKRASLEISRKRDEISKKLAQAKKEIGGL